MEFPKITVTETMIGEKNSIFIVPEVTLTRFYAPSGKMIDERLDYTAKGAAILRNIGKESK